MKNGNLLHALAAELKQRKPARRRKQSRHCDSGAPIDLRYDDSFYPAPSSTGTLSRGAWKSAAFEEEQAEDTEAVWGTGELDEEEESNSDHRLSESRAMSEPAASEESPDAPVWGTGQLEEESGAPGDAATPPHTNGKQSPAEAASTLALSTAASLAQGASASDDPETAAFRDDLKAILSGKKEHPSTQPAYAQSAATAGDEEDQPQPPAEGLKPHASGFSHAVFDQMGQPMSMATTFDLGSFALEKQLDAFEQQLERDERAAERRKQRAQPPVPVAATTDVSHSDFVEDLSAMTKPAAPSGPPQPALAPANYSTAKSNLSQALYGTGEHVLSGEVSTPFFNAATDKLDVSGVPFTYAELIAMGDLYDTYDDMIKASPAELRRLQGLIQKSRRHYEARVLGTGPGGPNASDTEWQAATAGRYLKLAEENFAHFAPSSGTLTPGISSTKKNHKMEWENYHRTAITAARAGTNSNDLLAALVINAFGDHFLTDAFAAGHMFNKDDVGAIFKSKVLSGGSVNPAGEAFFEQVAQQAFKGAVKQAFSAHETTERKILGIARPNIDSTSRFKQLLIGIMEQEPDVLGKTVVALAIHDSLNSFNGGVPVQNNRGDSWNLTGDGTLDAGNLGIMKNAVGQSIINVHDAVNSSAPLTDFYRKVWDYVPQPTPQATTIIQGLIQTFTDPTQAPLVTATVNMITNHYQELLNELVRRNILKRA